MEDTVQIEPKPETPPTPVMDVMPPATDGRAHHQPKEHATTQSTASRPESASPTEIPMSDNPNSGVGMAITATVLIVFGLAAIATYAYLKTAHP